MATTVTASTPQVFSDYEVERLQQTDNIKGLQVYSAQIDTGNPTSVVTLLSFPGRKFALYGVHWCSANSLAAATGLCDATFANSDVVFWIGTGTGTFKDIDLTQPVIFKDAIKFSTSTVSVSVNMVLIGRFL